MRAGPSHARWWWRGVERIEAHVAERHHAANVQVYAWGLCAVLTLLWALQGWAAERADFGALYRPALWRPSWWALGAVAAWMLVMAVWGGLRRGDARTHPVAVQLVLLPSIAALVLHGVGHGLHDTPLSMLLLNVLVFSRGLFTWREVRWAWALAAALVLGAEFVQAWGGLPYAPLLSAPVYTGGSLQPWWALWVRVLFILAGVLMSCLMLSLAGVVQRRRVELEALVRTDALTGLVNRREFMAVLEREAHRQARSGRRLSIVLFDVDHFKQVNDRWGHPVGDAVLARIGALLRTHTREQVDTAARLGGEEFALLLPDTDMNEACLVAEKIAARLREERFVAAGQGFAVTQSVGIAQVVEGRGDAALRVADRNLYQAKRAGRNQTVASMAFPENEGRVPPAS